jgi:hypothetical protein
VLILQDLCRQLSVFFDCLLELGLKIRYSLFILEYRRIEGVNLNLKLLVLPGHVRSVCVLTEK